MKKLHIEWKGTTPLLMHSCQGVNPLHPITIRLNELLPKRNKTEEDLRMISDLEWESGLYWSNGLGLFIPSQNIEATVREGAKVRKKGKDFTRAFSVTEMQVPLDIGENLTKEQLCADYRFRDVRAMRVQRSRIMRTRPRFDMWRLSFDAVYDEKLLDLNEIVQAMEYAGQYVGLCDSRPKYGQFCVTVEEIA